MIIWKKFEELVRSTRVSGSIVGGFRTNLYFADESVIDNLRCMKEWLLQKDRELKRHRERMG